MSGCFTFCATCSRYRGAHETTKSHVTGILRWVCLREREPEARCQCCAGIGAFRNLRSETAITLKL